MRRLLAAIFLAFAGADLANAAPSCIYNQTDQTLFMVVDGGNDTRIAQPVAPNAQLCLQLPSTDLTSTVGVFSDINALEGCSRLSRTSQSEILLEFAEFDNCRWADSRREF